MSVVAATEGSAATGGMAASPSASSSPDDARRCASTASVASVHQSFMDSEAAARLRASTQANDVVTLKVAPAVAATALPSPLPIPPPMSQWRALHSRSWSNTSQNFFDETDGGAEVPRGCVRDNILEAHTTLAGEAKRQANCTAEETATSSPAPKPSETQEGCSEVSGRCDTIEGGVGSADYGSSGQLHPALQHGLTCPYEHSRNPYLRAAAREMQVSPGEAPSNWADEGFTGGCGGLGSTSVLADNEWSTRMNGEGAPSFAQATHRVPQLTRPFGFSTQRSNATPRAALPAVSTIKETLPSAGGAASSTPLRGIPLFTRTRQPSRFALSSAPSLRQSVEEYGQLHLQEEAVHWYHRSSELEHRLARLQEAYDRQSKLLAAQWRAAERRASEYTNTTTTQAAVDAADADVKAGGRCIQSASHTPPSAGADWTAATRSMELSAERATALTSRSPDSLSPAYLDEVGLACSNGEVVEAGGAMAGRSAASPLAAPCTSVEETALAKAMEAAVHYAIPKPHSGIDYCHFESAFSDDATVVAADLSRSLVRRGTAEAAERPAGTRAADVVVGPTRTTIGIQTDGGASASCASFGREGGEAAHSIVLASGTPRTGGTGDVDCLFTPPTPSAILARQYAEMVSEMKSLQSRLDAAEQEAESLREMRATQDLRCDDLETQLLAKEEQLLRHAQQSPPTSPMVQATTIPVGPNTGGGEEEKSLLSDGSVIRAADPGESSMTPAVQLKPLIAQLKALLGSVRRVHNGFPIEREALEASKTEMSSEGPVALPLDVNSASATAEQFPSPSSGLEVHSVGDAAQLTSLVTQVHQTVLQVSQQYAALQAELEVVRADRNELIGEQSEQVRLLQQQILKKDREQLALMERLHSRQECVAAVDGGRGEGASATGPFEERPPTPVVDGPAVRDGAIPASLMVPPERAAAEDGSHALAERVERLTAQLAEAKTAAAAAQEAQRYVLTERLEQVQADLRQTRLRAEDEYDSLSGTIEALTRELADTKEALRIKEVSLRIALRSSSPALLLAAAEGPTDGIALETLSITAKSPTYIATDSLVRPPSALQPVPAASKEPATATALNDEGDMKGLSTVSASPSTPPTSTPSSSLHRHAVEIGMPNGAATQPQGAALSDTHSPPPSPLHHRGKTFVDDGTLRTLPCTVPVDGDAGEGGNECHGAAPAAAYAVLSSSSRERSSRGLTTSIETESYTTLPSLPRGRSSGGSTENVVGHAQSALEAMQNEDSRQAARGEMPGYVGASLPSTVKGISAGASDLPTRQHAAFASAVTAFDRRVIGSRRSASARIADSMEEEEDELPLPLPLRSPLFRNLSSPPSAASTSSSPLQNRTPPSQRSTGPTRTSFRARGSSSPSPLSNDPQRRTTSAMLSISSLSPEERLRNFLSSSADIVAAAAAAAFDETATTPFVSRMSTIPSAKRQTEWVPEADTPTPTFNERRAGMAGRSEARCSVPEDGATPGRTPISLLSERTNITPFSGSSTPSSGLRGSPHVSKVAARHTQASLRRYRTVWQQQESLLESLLSSPSS
ncbi:hypothetical protein ABL78_0907 [Leptomonas seymouri]|uniref:Uncharacterized protein n=1 Tax=Leptomonas seymouri TaxID=5684 RepID=A0A0N0P8H2_LEPSE|nr:hypothetical protein ABL78_0907 [Leptomonas seymouri]|eukprot:KPI89939.1 hypothetical protein ABL78_0907 [Leptomonas seymouri]